MAASDTIGSVGDPITAAQPTPTPDSPVSLSGAVSVMAVPVLIADYTPLCRRFAGLSHSEVVTRLEDNDELLHCLELINDVAQSAPWVDLYGGGADDVPGLDERLADPESFPGLKSNMIKQLSAPWSGVRSIVFEHIAPTSRDTHVVVRSHWNVSIVEGEPDWSRVAIVDLDVTEMRTAENNLAEGNRLETIGAIAAGVAHELNTPLQYITDNLEFIKSSQADLLAIVSAAEQATDTADLEGLAEILKRADISFLQEEIPDALEQSLEGIQAMSKIVRAMKEFSHAGSGEKEPADINHIVETAVTIGRNEWKYAADVEFELEADIPPIELLQQELRQVILNLVVNASHAIQGNHDGTKGQITISTRLLGDRVRVSVQDDGGGVPERLRDQIFEPFFTTKEVGKGTGQGLAMARRSIVDRHAGSLDLEVEEGVGSTFLITLPIRATATT